MRRLGRRRKSAGKRLEEVGRDGILQRFLADQQGANGGATVLSIWMRSEKQSSELIDTSLSLGVCRSRSNILDSNLALDSARQAV